MIDFTTLTCCSKSNTIIEFHAILYTNILKYTHCAIASFIYFCFVFSVGIGMQRIRKMWKLLWTVINQNCQSVSHITDVDGLNIDQKTKEKCKNSAKIRIWVEWKQQNGTHIYRATVSNWSCIDCLEKHLSPDHIQTWWPFRDCDYWNALECALHTQTHTKEEEEKKTPFVPLDIHRFSSLAFSKRNEIRFEIGTTTPTDSEWYCIDTNFSKTFCTVPTIEQSGYTVHNFCWSLNKNRFTYFQVCE